MKKTTRKNTVGEVYGRLTIIEDVYNHGKTTKQVLVKCECGTVKVVSYSNMKIGDTKSCGCYNLEKIRERLVTHGCSKTKLYYVWYNMRNRCYRVTDREYHNYGARGIKVCDEWKDSFANFSKWALGSGYKETDNRSCQIDRKENDKDYSPKNCRWVTGKRNSLNRRVTVMVELNGETKPLSDWCTIYGLKYKRVYQQVHRDGKKLADLIKNNKV